MSKASIWSEIRNNFYDDIENVICIDAWKTRNDNEEGKVIAKVCRDTGKVTYLDEKAKTDPYALEVIKETIVLIEKEQKSVSTSLEKEALNEKIADAGKAVNSWDEMKKRYPMEREEMDEETEKRFVDDCFKLYEKEGFSSVYWSPFAEYADRKGQKIEVIGRCTIENRDLCTLPMWEVRFPDGEIIEVHPEEVIPSEMRANGCKLFDDKKPAVDSLIAGAKEAQALQDKIVNKETKQQDNSKELEK